MASARIMCATAFLLGFACAVAVAEAPLDIGSRRELFVDTHLIARLDNAELELKEPCPAGPVLRFDKPWEGVFCGYVTVFQDGDKFRMYYRGMPKVGGDNTAVESTCYAESTDGKQFVKPELGLFEVQGTRKNNVVLADMPPFSHNFAPFRDTRPGVPADERYKALAGSSKSGLVAFASADGLRWRKMREEPVITEGAFDSQNVAFWSESEQCYVAYVRTWSEGDFGGFRWVSRATSKDFLDWTAPVEMDKGDAPWEHIYTNQTVPYFRAPHIYVSLAARFMPGRRVLSEAEANAVGVHEKYAGDCSDNVLMTSRGGHRYDRAFLEAFVKPGIGLENWTSRTNYPAHGVVQTGKHELSVYIQKNYGQPTGHIERYTLRPDGFASVRAPYAGGELMTKPLVFSGGALYLNFATSAAGDIRVELQRPDGTPIEGHTLADSAVILGDMLDRVVRWNGSDDVSALAGKPVRIRFVMRDADLYAIQFR